MGKVTVKPFRASDPIFSEGPTRYSPITIRQRLQPGFSRIALLGSDSYLRDIAQKNPHMRYVRVDGADHWYTGCEDVLCDEVSRFFEDVQDRLVEK